VLKQEAPRRPKRTSASKDSDKVPPRQRPAIEPAPAPWSIRELKWESQRSEGESPVWGGGLTVVEPGVQKGGARMTPKGWAVILERWPEKRNTIPTPNQPFPAPLPL